MLLRVTFPGRALIVGGDGADQARGSHTLFENAHWRKVPVQCRQCEALEELGWRDVVTQHQPSGASIGRG